MLFPSNGKYTFNVLLNLSTHFVISYFCYYNNEIHGKFQAISINYSLYFVLLNLKLRFVPMVQIVINRLAVCKHVVISWHGHFCIPIISNRI